MKNKNFLIMLIGQIISLFGNQILRFALPLHLLNQTGSAALFGLVSACSFIPMILLSPIGGMIADRLNKRNIFVALDFFTSGITLLFTLMLGNVNLATLILLMLILLYGIQGAYQPAVQASVPLLMKKEDLVKGNAAINLVSSLAALIGPVAGGAIYGFFGLYPILYVSIICFAFSAIMELFLKIPFKKEEKTASGNILKTGCRDLRESMIFIRQKQPVILKVCLIMAFANLFFSSLVVISLPVMITQMLGFSEAEGNRLYGYAEGALAAGCLIGGILAGVFAKKQKPDKQYVWLILSSIALLPIAAGFYLELPAKIIYVIILGSCFFMVTISSLFSIQMMSYLQILTPEQIMGKIIACAMCICMCAQPIGQSIYGILFEKWASHIPAIFLGSFLITALLSLRSRKIFRELGQTNCQINIQNK